MSQTTAKISRGGKHFEVLVDVDEAIKVKQGKGNINAAVVTNAIFQNLKAGDKANVSDMQKEFGSSDLYVVAEKIIKSGEILLPEKYVKGEQEKKYKQVVDFLSKNAVDQNGRPYTPNRILKALEEAHVNIHNASIESQMPEIVDALRKLIPIKLEMRKIRITLPAQFSGKAYGTIKEYVEKEEWLSNGDLSAICSIPAGLLMDFYDKLNSVTHGNALTEEVK
jgi:ribosome maturation protein SDO1